MWLTVQGLAETILLELAQQNSILIIRGCTIKVALVIRAESSTHDVVNVIDRNVTRVNELAATMVKTASDDSGCRTLHVISLFEGSVKRN
jgi:hypothetical protein